MTADAGAAASSSPWSPLRRPLFRGLWIASLASNIGTWMQEVGEGWLMTSLEPSPAMVSLVQAARGLPLFLLALPAGALADVLDRRRVLLVSQLWMLVGAAALGLLTLTGRITAWSLLGCAFAIGLGTAINSPAWQATVPELVERRELPQAVALNSLSFNVARAVGPALGGLVIATLGPGANFLLNAASFLGVVAVVAARRRQHHAGAPPAGRRPHGAPRHGGVLRRARHARRGAPLLRRLRGDVRRRRRVAVGPLRFQRRRPALAALVGEGARHVGLSPG